MNKRIIKIYKSLSEDKIHFKLDNGFVNPYCVIGQLIEDPNSANLKIIMNILQGYRDRDINTLKIAFNAAKDVMNSLCENNSKDILDYHIQSAEDKYKGGEICIYLESFNTVMRKLIA
jgi:hypothetical protein